tara:strand:+ start:407 stop:1336 length:930 start_codon:yes stop_codon:yes gene_type:complete
LIRDNIVKTGFQVFQQQLISPSKLGVSSRQVNYWIENTLLPFASAQSTMENPLAEEQLNSFSKPNHKWVRLNLAEAVWACIVKQLFQFKVPLVTIQDLTKKVWQTPREEKYADKVFNYHIKCNPYSLKEEDINMLKYHLADDDLMEHHFRTFINPFTDMVKNALYRSKIPYTMLYVPDTNDFEFYYGNKSLITDLSSAYVQKPMISIPIIPIIAKVLEVDYFNRKIKKLDYLTDIEKKVRDVVVFKRPKVVDIALGEQNINLVTVTEQHKNKEELSKYILFNKIEKGSTLMVKLRNNDHYVLTLIKQKK